ncbi:hypothetical protein ACPCGZ_11075 [Propionibacteriaceae bacterium G1746]|uniref:hypothetical protein n=1 Tax=Aestuariimicrobium sp. G57 TaxID=3418485 RepID=UPI003C154F87
MTNRALARPRVIQDQKLHNWHHRHDRNRDGRFRVHNWHHRQFRNIGPRPDEASARPCTTGTTTSPARPGRGRQAQP